jgi:hypothetical protein
MFKSKKITGVLAAVMAAVFMLTGAKCATIHDANFNGPPQCGHHQHWDGWKNECVRNHHHHKHHNPNAI